MLSNERSLGLICHFVYMCQAKSLSGPHTWPSKTKSCGNFGRPTDSLPFPLFTQNLLH